MSYTGDDMLMVIARLLSVIQDPLLRWCGGERDSVAAQDGLERRSRYALTFLWIAVTLLIAMFVPDISKVISVIGGISAFFIFIFPVGLTAWGVLTLICGAFIFGQSTTVAVMQILGKM
ncbi:hypothetical protein CRUP_011856 [Coryphaenoides rupestris]|nr:hypothetical protein CRUP_011856 [Coryphaenoides rupestris]